MAREKVTITMDREKAALARKLSGADSTSDTVDVAFDALIKRERLRHDIAAYRHLPSTPEEIRLADVGSYGDLEDDTDWEQLYAESE